MDKKTLFLYSLFVSGSYFIYKIVLFYGEIDFQMNSVFPALPLLITITGVLAYIAYQLPDKNNFLDDFKVLASFGLLSSVLSALFIYTYYAAFDVDFFNLRIAESEYVLRQMDDISEEQIKQQIENMRFIYTPFRYAAISLSGITFFGLIVSALMAGGRLFMKRLV